MTNTEISTTPPIEPCPSPAPETRPPHQPKDPVARLPRDVRHMLNRMLDDGLPYHILIEELGQAAQHPNPQNLADWVEGPFQDYLKSRKNIERVQNQVEFAKEFLKELEGSDPDVILRACRVVAALQIFHALFEYGDEVLREMLYRDPANYLSMLNSLCHLSNASLQEAEAAAASQ